MGQSKIYTKTGDKGMTGVIGKRLSKDSDVIELIGELDELNTCVGVCISFLQPHPQPLSYFIGEGGRSEARPGEVIDQRPTTDDLSTHYSLSTTNLLLSLQSTIFSIGAIIAGAEKIVIDFEDLTKQLEIQIDEWDKQLPQLQNFILAGGHPAAAQLHYTRTIARKAERRLVSYIGSTESMESFQHILKYMNRLSDWLFVLARYINFLEGVEEQKWQG